MLIACLVILALGMVFSIICAIFYGFADSEKNEDLLKQEKRINTAKYSAIIGVIALFIAYLLVCFINPETAITFGNFIIILCINIPFLFVFFAAFSSLRSCFILLGLNCGVIIILALLQIPFILPIGVSTIIGFALCILFLSMIAKRQYQFKDNANFVKEGTTLDSIEVLFGTKPANWIKDDGKLTITYEKTQWRGFLRGGTIVRSVKVTLVDEKVVKVTTKNMDVPVW